MKAIEFDYYGDSSVLQYVDIEEPIPKQREILVRSVATSINPYDIKLRSGSMRAISPISFPYIPGTDISGVVQAVGSKVTRIKPGDLIFATTPKGAYADMVCVNEDTASIIPGILTINEAAAMAVPLTVAYSLLIEAGNLQPGEKVLIHGAAGGVGHVVLQMAKVLGAHVIATASGEGIEFVETLGADEVIDYKEQDFTELVSDLDMVIDLVGGETQLKSYPLIKKGGKLLSIVMPTSDELAEQYEITAQFIVAEGSYKKLDYGKKLVESQQILIHISRVFELYEAPDAQDALSEGGVIGKIILNF